jgi:molybdopterin molybdotransferase
MLSVEQARAAMLASAYALPQELVGLDEALGRTLAADILARGAQPPFTASAMDGWAVRRTDAPGALRIIGESAAGKRFAGALGKGEAVRIFTGAPVPDGADTVIIQEEAQREGDVVRVGAPDGANIRKRGLDFEAGDKLLALGTRLDGVAIALAAAAGHDPLPVFKRPRVAILATGDELARPGGRLGPDQIFEAVSFGVAALAQSWGAEVKRVAAARDKLDTLVSALKQCAANADIVVTIGGASVGDHDLVKPAAKQLDAALIVENVAVRPGKPTWFARGEDIMLVGLPGNPASALVCAHLFLRPLLQRMQGGTGTVWLGRAALGRALPANGNREHYIRASLGVNDDGHRIVEPWELQDSSLLGVFDRADALIRLKPNAPAAESGTIVDVLRLDRL